MFAVSRFAHYLKCMVRDKIGSTKEKDELQRWLQDWINEYVDGDPAIRSEATKARKPLADARVEVIENEENPGLLQRAASICGRTIQLEGMDIGLSLVSRLPGARRVDPWPSVRPSEPARYDSVDGAHARQRSTGETLRNEESIQWQSISF